MHYQTIIRTLRSLLPGLFLLLIVCSHIFAKEQSGWPDERRVGSFVFHANFRLDGYLPMLQRLEELDREVSRRLKLERSAEPIHLFLFAKKGTYQRYMKIHFPKVPMRKALYIKDDGPGMVFAYISSDFEVDLRHETTHALLHTALPMVPLWLDEGLAEYFELPPERREKDNSYRSKVQWNYRLGFSPNLGSLEKLRGTAQMKEHHYRDSWAWVHYLLHGNSTASQELRAFLADIANRTPPGRFQDRIEGRIPEIHLQLKNHIMNWKPTETKASDMAVSSSETGNPFSKAAYHQP